MNKLHSALQKTILFLVALFTSGSMYAQNESKVKSVNNTNFEKLIQSKDVILLDVRTPQEFSEGHIPNAINLDYRNSDFPHKIKELNKDKTIAVYCRSGNRSKLAAKKLNEAGFNVFELNKGIMNWSGSVCK